MDRQHLRQLLVECELEWKTLNHEVKRIDQVSLYIIQDNMQRHLLVHQEKPLKYCIRFKRSHTGAGCCGKFPAGQLNVGDILLPFSFDPTLYKSLRHTGMTSAGLLKLMALYCTGRTRRLLFSGVKTSWL